MWLLGSSYHMNKAEIVLSLNSTLLPDEPKQIGIDSSFIQSLSSKKQAHYGYEGQVSMPPVRLPNLHRKAIQHHLHPLF